MTTSNISILKVENLTASYAVGQNVLKNISFSLNDSDLMAILGFNGAGKSTCMRIISGLQKFYSGSIYMQGESITNLSFHTLSKTRSVVLTGRTDVLQTVTVIEILKIARSPYTNNLHRLGMEDEKIIQNVIEELKLNQFLNKKMYQLSDGEAQKVFIARALIQETPIIFLDEPTAHLDVVNRMDIFQVLVNLSSHYKKTIIISTHEIDFALKFAEKFLLLGDESYYFFEDRESLNTSEYFRQIMSLYQNLYKVKK